MAPPTDDTARSVGPTFTRPAVGRTGWSRSRTPCRVIAKFVDFAITNPPRACLDRPAAGAGLVSNSDAADEPREWYNGGVPCGASHAATRPLSTTTEPPNVGSVVLWSVGGDRKSVV